MTAVAPHAVVVAGARPNFIKVKPVIDALTADGVRTTLVHTGQHYDEAMSGVFFADLGLRPPDHHLEAGSGSHAVQTAAVMTAFEPLLLRLAPDVVVVVGDVNSTLACALVAAKAGVAVAHVEAGLRSGDRAMPEEINRIVTDRLSDLLFAPSPEGVAHLVAEGVPPESVHLVGNVMVDTLLACRERARARPTLAELGLRSGGYGLVTLHRPSNVDDPEVLDGLLAALGEIAGRCPLVFPVHPRTANRLVGRLPAGLRLLGPVGYLDCLALQMGARLVLTDSGGVQEESTVLGVPCLTLRDNTERPITVTEGTNRVVGRSPDAVVAAAFEWLERPPPPRCPALWDGRAGQRISAVLVRTFAGSGGGQDLRDGVRELPTPRVVTDRDTNLPMRS
ncbi:UDP-N-acetylglucosamine 2-epimerase (non-hydrolysing) [Parafrankia irregularis]|uniref:UDP-N-acetylglucosamine 2-epimerase (Non-hydrolysing) n=1 Tax=Parafrankia irregularis TaxID=795642 RepID=A0A0S4QGE9_9ACTN|nr:MULTISPECIES: UDP-N-acetylglucosamine 2-epimerase (non-hydrolyzing) [Parafrankia]MBE3199562.1 UDP-N-acetylglucosamine 2-epimerase (non-hydrolyzing) [Parafrankia sp. CH37]CUU53772.1 UDP-N-acetylglucosamine 2-epimerase (non-hydrolysing) [Parafrankia irregularis]